jgi:uncharacterized protein (TIGR00252 family)
MPEIRDPLFYEKELWQKGIKMVAGIDEAGRGPWAGPVVAAAVIWPEDFYLDGLKDSKALTPKKRNEFFKIIKEKAISYGVGIINAEEIDRVNILQATFKAMRQALAQLQSPPQFLLVDGKHRIPEIDIPQLALVKGDSLSLSIAAASILAKVTRDEIMLGLEEKFPDYGFSRHKGYGTALHQKALKRFGPSRLHRFSFRPVENASGYISRRGLGNWGEEQALRFLEDKGYKIISRNVRTRLGEVDIVAEDKGTVVFIEVKTRSSNRFGRGEEAVSLAKQRRLVKLAFQFMKIKNLTGKDFRFDVLSAFRDGGGVWRMELIQNAFEGG